MWSRSPLRAGILVAVDGNVYAVRVLLDCEESDLDLKLAKVEPLGLKSGSSRKCCRTNHSL